MDHSTYVLRLDRGKRETREHLIFGNRRYRHGYLFFIFGSSSYQLVLLSYAKSTLVSSTLSFHVSFHVRIHEGPARDLLLKHDAQHVLDIAGLALASDARQAVRRVAEMLRREH